MNISSTFLLSAALLTLLTACQMPVEEQSEKLALSTSTIDGLPEATKNAYVSTYKKNRSKKRFAQLLSSNSQSPSLMVTVSDGAASMPPNYQSQAFKTASMEVFGNRCDEIYLYPLKGGDIYSTLTLCYLNDSLYVDASSIDPDYPIGSVIIPISSQTADKQKFCNLSTKGNAKLQSACLTITQQHQEAHSRPLQVVNKAPKNKDFKPTLRDSSGERYTENIY